MLAKVSGALYDGTRWGAGALGRYLPLLWLAAGYAFVYLLIGTHFAP